MKMKSSLLYLLVVFGITALNFAANIRENEDMTSDAKIIDADIPRVWRRSPGYCCLRYKRVYQCINYLCGTRCHKTGWWLGEKTRCHHRYCRRCFWTKTCTKGYRCP